MYSSQLTPRRTQKTPKWIWIPYITLLISVSHYIQHFSWVNNLIPFKLGYVIWPLCIVAGIVSFLSNLHIRFSAVYFLGLYVLWYLVGLVIAPQADTRWFITEAVYKALFFALTVLFMNHCAKFGIMGSFAIFLRIGLVVSFSYYIELVDSLNTTVARVFNPVYYFLFFLPYAFLEKKPAFKYAELGLVLVAVILSQKRTALFCVIAIAILAVYLQGKDIVRGRKKFFRSLVIAALIGIGAYLLLREVLARNALVDWNSRLETAENASGRWLRWDRFFRDMEAANAPQLLFGHGVTYPYYHNDLMQVIYNSGIIGTVLYLGLCIQLLLLYRQMVKQSYRHTLAYGASLIIFFLDSAVGQVVVVHTWTLQMMVFWGIVLGDFYRERLLKSEGFHETY